MAEKKETTGGYADPVDCITRGSSSQFTDFDDLEIVYIRMSKNRTLQPQTEVPSLDDKSVPRSNILQDAYLSTKQSCSLQTQNSSVVGDAVHSKSKEHFNTVSYHPAHVPTINAAADCYSQVSPLKNCISLSKYQKDETKDLPLTRCYPPKSCYPSIQTLSPSCYPLHWNNIINPDVVFHPQHSFVSHFPAQGVQSSFGVFSPHAVYSSEQRCTSHWVNDDGRNLPKQDLVQRAVTKQQSLYYVLCWTPQSVRQQSVKYEQTLYQNLYAVRCSYMNFEDYFDTYFPLLLIETFQRLHENCKIAPGKLGFHLNIESVRPAGQFLELDCRIVLFTKRQFSSEGQLLLLHVTKEERTEQAFGFIASRVSTSSVLYKEDVQLCVVTSASLLSARPKETVYANPLYNLNCFLNQVGALLAVEKSALRKTILSPCTTTCKIVIARWIGITTATLVDSTTSEILTCLSFREPTPRVVLVEELRDPGLAHVLLALVKNVKRLGIGNTSFKTLLCCRSASYLQKLSKVFISDKSVKTVILSRYSVSENQLLKTYTLDEIVSNIVKQTNGSLPPSNSKLYIDAEEAVLNSSDVLLSIVTECYRPNIHKSLTPNGDLLIKLCVVAETRLCTEPEALVPLNYGIEKFVYIVDDAKRPHIFTQIAKTYGYCFQFCTRIKKTLR